MLIKSLLLIFVLNMYLDKSIWDASLKVNFEVYQGSGIIQILYIFCNSCVV